MRTRHSPGITQRTAKQLLDGTAESYPDHLIQVLSAAAFGAAVRSHWGIENQVHWVLDVTFHEDASRIRAGHAAENVAILRHLALNLLRQMPVTAPRSPRSLKAKRLKAAWDTDYLFQILTTG